uniref:Globin domain-containing protein n=1 Tax=Oryzias latipes TaxID=8090 RepID=A0A3P9K6G2_ORYLA
QKKEITSDRQDFRDLFFTSLKNSDGIYFTEAFQEPEFTWRSNTKLLYPYLSFCHFYFLRNMDRIQETHAALSRLHYECVDPDNFKLLGDCITITIACKLKEALNPQVQAVWQKFLCAVVEPMNSQNKSNVDKNQNEVKLK